MNIAFITTQYPPKSIGGAGLSSKLIVQALREIGVEVDVYALIGDDKKTKKVDDNKYVLYNGENYPGPNTIGQNTSAYLNLPNLQKYDLIHVYNVNHLPACVIKSNNPVLATFNNHMWVCMDPVRHLKDGLPRGDLVTSYSYAKSSGYSGIKAPLRLGIQYIGKFLAKKTDAYTVQNQGMKEVLSKYGYSTQKMNIVPNILDTRFLTDSDNSNKILYVGRMGRYKGPYTVIRAYYNLPQKVKQNWALEMYGNGSIKEKISDYIDDKNIDNAEIKYSPYSELPEVYSKAGLLIHSSKYTEPFSRTWLEAMATGTPILCSKNPSSKAVLNSTAEFYNPFDVEDLTEKLLDLLRSPSRREQMKQKGLSQVNQYKPEIIADSYNDVYSEVIRSS